MSFYDLDKDEIDVLGLAFDKSICTGWTHPVTNAIIDHKNEEEGISYWPYGLFSVEAIGANLILTN